MNETFYVQGLKTTSTKFVLPISKNAFFVSKSQKETNSIPKSRSAQHTYESFKCTYATRLPRKPSSSSNPTWYRNAKDLDGRKENVCKTIKRPFWTL